MTRAKAASRIRVLWMTRSPRKENVKPYSVLAAVVLAVSFLMPGVVVHIPDPLNKMNYKMASDIMI